MLDSEGCPQRGRPPPPPVSLPLPCLHGLGGRTPRGARGAAAGGSHGTGRAAGGAAPWAPNDPEPQAQEPVPAGEVAPAAHTAAPAAPPPGGGPDAQGAATATPAGRAAAPGTPLARGTGPTQAPSSSPGTATAAAECKEGVKYRAHTKPSHTHSSPPKPYPPKAALPEGRPRPVLLRRPSVRHRASRCRSCSGSETPGAWSRRGETAIRRDGLLATGARGEGQKATEGGWYAVEGDKRQGRGRARAAAPGDGRKERA